MIFEKNTDGCKHVPYKISCTHEEMRLITKGFGRAPSGISWDLWIACGKILSASESKVLKANMGYEGEPPNPDSLAEYLGDE